MRGWAVVIHGRPGRAGVIVTDSPRYSPGNGRDHENSGELVTVMESADLGGVSGVREGACRDRLDTALRCLGLLAAVGFAERSDQGWRPESPRDTRRAPGAVPR
jgi:hypothetical protein